MEKLIEEHEKKYPLDKEYSFTKSNESSKARKQDKFRSGLTLDLKGLGLSAHSQSDQQGYTENEGKDDFLDQYLLGGKSDSVRTKEYLDKREYAESSI